jgi:hypothetical protein
MVGEDRQAAGEPRDPVRDTGRPVMSRVAVTKVVSKIGISIRRTGKRSTAEMLLE